MSRDNRKHERVEARRLVRYSFDGGATVRAGATRDVSRGGLSLVTREKLPDGIVGVVWLPLEEGPQDEVPVLCEVRSCRAFQVRGNYRIGLRVIHPRDDEKALVAWVTAALDREAAPDPA